MQKNFNTLWEFTGGKEDKDNFIQKALKVCKVFKVKPLKTPKPDVPSKKTTYNLFCKDIRKTKEEMQGVPVSKASAIISKEWKKVKAIDLYEEEKKQHEEAPQRYQEDHMEEMEIINLHKKCNKKARKVSQPKKASASPKSDEPKKTLSKSVSRKVSGLLMIQARKDRSLKKHQVMEKRPLQRQEKKLRRGRLKMIKRQKYLLC